MLDSEWPWSGSGSIRGLRSCSYWQIEELQVRLPGRDLLNEIAVTESAIGRSQAESRFDAERDVASADALGQLLQKKARQLELQAYLKGLKYANDRTGRQARADKFDFNENAPIINPSMTAY